MSRCLKLAVVVVILGFLSRFSCVDEDSSCENDVTNPGCSCICDYEDEEEEEDDCQWKLVYKAVAGNGKDVRDGFSNATSINMGDSWAQNIRSNKRYRNSDILDSWHAFYIQQIRVDIYDKLVRAVRLIFDGKGSTADDWFTSCRLLVSPYEDIKDAQFGIDGKGSMHTFLISSGEIDCDECAYISVIEPNEAADPCEWEDLQNTPYFLYGKDLTACNNFTASPGIGDRFLIFVKVCDIN